MTDRNVAAPIAAFALSSLLCALAARADDASVSVSNNIYSPQHVTVLVGETVTWTRVAGFHNVLADDASFRCAAGCDQTGGNGNPSMSWTTATFRFHAPDLDPYHCEVHGLGMNGTVRTMQAVFADGFESGDEFEWAPLVAAGDTCSSAILHSLSNVPAPGTLQGSSNDFDVPFGASCFAPGTATHGRDKVYEVLVPGNTTVQVTVMPEFASPDPEFDPVVYVQDMDDCGETPQTIACLGAASSAGPGQPEVLVIGPNAQQRIFHVYVDSFDASVAGSNYTITVESL